MGFISGTIYFLLFVLKLYSKDAKGEMSCELCPSLSISETKSNKQDPETLTCQYHGNQTIVEVIWLANGTVQGTLIVNGLGQGTLLANGSGNGTLLANDPVNGNLTVNESCQIMRWTPENRLTYTCDITKKVFNLSIIGMKSGYKYDEWWTCGIVLSENPSVLLKSNVLIVKNDERVSRSELQSIEGPDGPAFIKGLKVGLPYRVIEKRQGQLTCVIKGGSPLPTLTWTCFNIGTSDSTGDTRTVSKTARWRAVRGPDMKCTCYYSHPIRSGFLSIQVQTLYPPSKPVFYIKNNEVSGTVKIIRHNGISIQCSSSGRPDIEYSWTWNAITTSGSIMTITSVEQNCQYICNVKNFMDQSDGDVVIGTNSSSINIKVLYPPMVRDIQNRSIAEGDTLKISCPVIVGNPHKTTFKWKRLNDSKEWRTQILEIVNVSRDDAMFYSCEAANIMRETGTLLRITLPHSKTFFLNVWYGAIVTDFYVDGFIDKFSVTVNEMENVHLYCNVDSNPVSNISIKNHKDSVIKSGSGVNGLNVSLASVSCLDTGIYTCSGSNGYYSETAMKKITLFVNCVPMVHPRFELKTILMSSENHSVVFTFKTLAYPEPTADDFKWFGWYNGQWIPLKNNQAFQIHTRNLESYLTVNIVNRTLYGIYKLIVKNPMGQLEQLFLLQSTESPTPRICSNSGKTPVIISIVLGFVIAILVLCVCYLSFLLRRKGGFKEQTVTSNLIANSVL